MSINLPLIDVIKTSYGFSLADVYVGNYSVHVKAFTEGDNPTVAAVHLYVLRTFKSTGVTDHVGSMSRTGTVGVLHGAIVERDLPYVASMLFDALAEVLRRADRGM